MNQSRRILIAAALIVLIVGAVLGIDALRRASATRPAAWPPTTTTPLPAGSIPIYFNDTLVGGFAPGDLEKLQKAQFTDSAENKPQEGWLLRDILLLYIPADQLQAGTRIVVSSSSRQKSAELTWAEVQEPANQVMFDLSNRGTLKLISLLPELDERDEWVQDSDRIEVSQP